jgi:hypothetical protein
MKIKVLTSYKPGTWNEYAKRAVDSVLKFWPEDTQVAVYHESQSQDIFKHSRVEWIDVHEEQPELVKFKTRHKDDPIANGELQEIPGGVRRSPKLKTHGGKDATKGSFLWNAVRFANKVFCVTHALKNSPGYDYIIWLDADTYTFRPIPKEFFNGILPADSMLTYLGRENPQLKDGGKYPECGFVGYNLNHPEIKNYTNDWEKLYVTDEMFQLLEWTDCSTLWHLSKIYQKEKNVKVNDIGYWKGVKGHHVFINSELGLYIDHFKGNRKLQGKSKKNDFRPQQAEAMEIQSELDYWKNLGN